MNALQLVRASLESSLRMVAWFGSDFTAEELLVRPVPLGNHPAWQWGHLISSEANGLLPKLLGASAFPLPEGFAAQHGRETAMVDPPTGFYTPAEYTSLHAQVRGATLAWVDQATEADLDEPSGWEMAPTLGSILTLISHHDMMHGGQFSVVRRKLGKPVLF